MINKENKEYNRKAFPVETVFFYYLNQVDKSLIREYATSELRAETTGSSIDIYSVDKNIAFEIDYTLRYHCELDIARDNNKNKRLVDAGRKVIRFRNKKSPTLDILPNVKIVDIPNLKNKEKFYFEAVKAAAECIEEIYGTKIDVNYERDIEAVKALQEKLSSEYMMKKETSSKSKVIASAQKSVSKVNSKLSNFKGLAISDDILKILARLEAKSPVQGLNGETFENYKEMAFTYNLNYTDFMLEFASGNKRLCSLLREKGVDKKYRTEYGCFDSLEDVATIYDVNLTKLKNLIEKGTPLDKAIILAEKPSFERNLDVSINDIPKDEISKFIRTDLDGNVYSSVNVLCKRYGISVKTYQKRLASGLKKSQCLSKF